VSNLVFREQCLFVSHLVNSAHMCESILMNSAHVCEKMFGETVNMYASHFSEQYTCV
jgi:hypothetical protein